MVRSARAGDARALSELAIRSKSSWGYAGDFIEACRAELSYSAAQIRHPDSSFSIAEVESAMAGFYAIVRRSANEFELEALFVEPTFIGKGIGRLLLDHACRTAAARGGTTLRVQSDPHADGFYRAAGGVLVGEEESGAIPGRRLPVFSISLQGVHIT